MVQRPDLLIDITRMIWRAWAGRHPTGIDRVCLAYLRHYGTRAQAVVQYPRFRRILVPKLSAKLFTILSDPPKDFRRKLISLAIRNLPQLLISCRAYGRDYLNIGHTGLDDPDHVKWVKKTGVRAIYFVHDLIPITHPQYCRTGEDKRHKRRMITMLECASAIIGNSQDTLNHLTKFADDHGYSMPPSTAAWLGTIKLPKAKLPKPVDRPYFIILGTIEGRKNHRMLIDIWSQMIYSGVKDIPLLIIIGQRGWECEDVITRLDNDPVIKPHIIELSDCDDQTLSQYLTHARALLFPSFTEGYGMPLMEAFDMETPAIASDIPIFREIGGDIAEFVGLDGIKDWQNMILSYHRDPSRQRAAQLRRLENYQPPSWEDHFKLVDLLLPKSQTKV